MSPKAHTSLLLSATLSFAIIFSSYCQENDPSGAWQHIERNPQGNITHTLLLSGGYFSHTEYQSETGAFISTRGGSWQLNEGVMSLEYEFDTRETSSVGRTQKYKVGFSGERLLFEASGDFPKEWSHIDSDPEGPLYGAWLFSGRQSNGEISRRNTDQPRKTMKLLTGNRFQWIAYNTETKEFFGTGGGSYTAVDGVYTERIEFFSRDDKRVGAELSFEYHVDGDEWHHRGKSSAGEPMYEIWSRRE